MLEAISNAETTIRQLLADERSDAPPAAPKRPPELGLSLRSPPAFSSGVAKLGKKDRADIAARAAAGEIIKL